MKIRKTGLLLLTILLCAIMCVSETDELTAYVLNEAGRAVVVLDPGHGGIDGGAESSDGTSEKDINLAIASQLRKMLENKGIRVIMTRTSGEGLYDPRQDAAIRTLKTNDLYERKRIIDEADADLTVSIHLNSFTQDPSVKGAQVFFPSEGDEELVGRSEAAASLIQAELNKTINKEKKRTELGKNDVFLLKEITCPIVIAECGFLSNREDASMLKNATHQKKIAEALCISICGYLGNNEEKSR